MEPRGDVHHQHRQHTAQEQDHALPRHAAQRGRSQGTVRHTGDSHDDTTLFFISSKNHSRAVVYFPEVYNSQRNAPSEAQKDSTMSYFVNRNCNLKLNCIMNLSFCQTSQYLKGLGKDKSYLLQRYLQYYFSLL